MRTKNAILLVFIFKGISLQKSFPVSESPGGKPERDIHRRTVLPLSNIGFNQKRHIIICHHIMFTISLHINHFILHSGKILLKIGLNFPEHKPNNLLPDSLLLTSSFDKVRRLTKSPTISVFCCDSFP